MEGALRNCKLIDDDVSNEGESRSRANLLWFWFCLSFLLTYIMGVSFFRFMHYGGFFDGMVYSGRSCIMYLLALATSSLYSEHSVVWPGLG